MNSYEALIPAREPEHHAVAARQPPVRGAARSLLVAARPRQWVKNLLVLAAPAAAGMLDSPSALARTAVAFVVFCLLSSATYLINDVRDVEEDRRHVTKRLRPIAGGQLSARRALSAALLFGAAGIALTLLDGVALLAVAAGYLALTISYTYLWRERPLFDVLAVAAGFVARAVAGGAAVGVGLSHWFLLVTCFGALFLVSGKRYAELARGVVVGARPVLASYSRAGLQLLLGVSLVGAWLSYCLWAFNRPTHHALVFGALTLIPFSLWLARYLALLRAGAGEAPEELVLGDRALLALSTAWCALFAIGVYVG